ncbi:alpha-2-macroglobulin family protein [Marinimicrobium sp. ARAG 43.8]|uniref:alpha-2-macroglobulin family protein n=1 Tax=Marinimicrobium sp. ARAG 43.8 TaxID=3418719 RepID=UPI003CF6D24E
MQTRTQLIRRALWLLVPCLLWLAGCERDSGSAETAAGETVAEAPLAADAPQTLGTFDLALGALTPVQDDPERMRLAGELTLPDGAELDQVRSLIDVEMDGTLLPVEWNVVSKPVHFRFEVNDIERTDAARTLQVRWNGEAVGSAQKGARDIAVPALGTLTVTGVQVVPQPRLMVEVSFSQPLNREQNLSGLVQLDGEEIRPQVDGHRLRIYPESEAEEPVRLQISDLVRDATGRTLGKPYEESVVLSLVTPGVRFNGSSSILPPAEQLSVPFEAARVDSVQVTAFKTFEGNMGQYLQYRSLNDATMDNATGRYLWRKTYRLPEPATGGWQQYHLDLTELMAQHPDGLVQLKLSVDRSNSLYSCGETRPDEPMDVPPESSDGDWSYNQSPKPSWYQQYYESRGYWDYSERNNPCHESYYRYSNNTEASRAFQVSSIGLLAKQGGDDELLVIATSLLDAAPLPGTTVRAYNFQQQPIGDGETDEYGMARIAVEGRPFFLTAERNGKTGYLRLARAEALPTNQFDVGGESVRDGLKGFLYGERDVWRPGDDIHLTFMLNDPDGVWPDDHPVTLDLFDPRGNKVLSQVAREPLNGFYTYTLRTDESAPTGNWRAVVHLGNRYFDKVVKVESIMPNRLKLDLAFAETPLRQSAMPAAATLSARWLHGANAGGLKADSEVRLTPAPTRFEGYSQFVFDDPARSFASATQTVFEGNLNTEGEARFEMNLPVESPPPGRLSATFINRVFEPGGAFSTALRRFDYLPFEHWVGVNIPEGEGYNGAIARDQDQTVTLQSLTAEGKPEAGRELRLTLYRVDWRWWWDRSGEDLASFVASNNHTPLVEEVLTANGEGRAQWTLAANTYDWGRYLLRVCDTQGNHCSGDLVYLGWSAGNAVSPASATQLMLSTDKDAYTVGETAQIRLPDIDQGRALLSVENGRRVLESRWLDLDSGQTTIELPVTESMAPNIYAHITLLLPHQERSSDSPMRLYGVVPIRVNDPDTRLTPDLTAPEQVRPESRFDVTVSESDGKPMTYTLALVDEGLLGITGYRTPNPHDHFYQREALGVYTWDLFDQVVGAYGASLQRVLAIGGSDAEDEDTANPRERRFPPVVQFLGPFELEAGTERQHSIELPPYLGEVRLMVVAGENGAYGSAENSVTVSQPLSLLATLPRVVGPGETISLPVQLFASDESIEEVTLSAEAEAPFTLSRAETKVDLAGEAEALVELGLTVDDRIGTGTVTVTARSGDEVATQSITLTSRAPNPPSVRREQYLLPPGETWTPSLMPHGMAGTNQASLEVGRLPTLNLEQRLGYLIRYPHGCLEQVVSAAFPQLYLDKLVTLNDEQAAEREDNIRATIDRLAGFQSGSGGFQYWPGGGYVNEWASVYAGHFLTEARRLGYGVPDGLFTQWLNQERTLARRTRDDADRWVVQAYRLYVLTLADAAETPAMNRLRERLRNNDESATARRLLASAYYHLGLDDAGRELVSGVTTVPDYNAPGYTYGSSLRDRAVWLQLLVRADDTEAAWDQAERVAERLSSSDWYSTQSVAWALLAMADFAGEQTPDAAMDFALETPGVSDWQPLQSRQHWYRQELGSTDVRVRNDSDYPLRVTLSNRGTPVAEDEQAEREGLNLSMEFTTVDGESLTIDQLPQGTDFKARITVAADFADLGRDYLENLAMTLGMPSGWEIRNERLEGGDMPDGFDYIDIRDDRVTSYFSLWKNHRWSWRYSDTRQERVTLELLLNAAYTGEFYLPGWRAEAMYDGRVHASTAGRWVRVVKPE